MGEADFLAIVAESLALLSGALLVVPAIGVNRTLRDVQQTQETFAQRSHTPLGKAASDYAGPIFKDARLLHWSPKDQRFLVWGLATLIASSALKLVVASGWGVVVNHYAKTLWSHLVG